LSWLTHYPKK